jgi:RNA polymerase sigma factor (sigma-70 family)
MSTTTLPATDVFPGVDALHDYLRSIGSYAVLSRDEVRDLCVAIEAGVLAGERLDRGVDDVVLRRELQAVRRRGADASRTLTVHNLKLVVSVAKRLHFRPLPLEDLIQAGNAGLIAAVQRFDHTLGYTFSTYATWWIRKHVQQELAGSRAIRLPPGPLREVLELARTERELETRHGRPATAAEVAGASDLPAARVEQLRRVGRPLLSLDEPLDGLGETTLMAVLEGDAPEVPDELHDRILHGALADAVGGLDAEHAQVVDLLYGLGGNRRVTPRRVSQLLHVPEARVVALEQEALAQLHGRIRAMR